MLSIERASVQVPDGLEIRDVTSKTDEWMSLDERWKYSFEGGGIRQFEVRMIATRSGEGNSAVPSQFDVLQNYPNPFNGTTTFTVSIPQTGHLAISVYDITGRLLGVVGEPTLREPGRISVGWSTDLSSGAYACVFVFVAEGMREEAQRQIRRIILLK